MAEASAPEVAVEARAVEDVAVVLGKRSILAPPALICAPTRRSRRSGETEAKVAVEVAVMAAMATATAMCTHSSPAAATLGPARFSPPRNRMLRTLGMAEASATLGKQLAEDMLGMMDPSMSEARSRETCR